MKANINIFRYKLLHEPLRQILLIQITPTKISIENIKNTTNKKHTKNTNVENRKNESKLNTRLNQITKFKFLLKYSLKPYDKGNMEFYQLFVKKQSALYIGGKNIIVLVKHEVSNMLNYFFNRWLKVG